MSVIDKIKLDGTTYDVGKTPDTTLAVSGSPADAAKVGTELNKKVDKVTGKGLSTEDFTTAEKTKLAGIAEGATNIVIDPTLTQSGQAADALETGKIKEDLSTLNADITYSIDDGYYDANGNVQSPTGYWQEQYTTKIDVTKIKNIKWNYACETTVTQSGVNLVTWDKNGTFISRITIKEQGSFANANGIIDISTLRSDVGYLAFHFGTRGHSVTFDIKANYDFVRMIDETNDRVDIIEDAVAEDTPYTISDGYYSNKVPDAIQTPSAYNQEKLTGKFSVSNVALIRWSLKLSAMHSNMYVSIAKWDKSGTWIGEEILVTGISGDSVSGIYTVPDNVGLISMQYRTFGLDDTFSTDIFYSVEKINKTVEKVQGIAGSNVPYYGTMKPYGVCNIDLLATISTDTIDGSQPNGIAVYDDVLAMLFDTGGIVLYNLSSNAKIGEYMLASASASNHANNAHFSNEMGTDYPLLYVSECYGTQRCFVEDITDSSSTLIQTISFDNGNGDYIGAYDWILDTYSNHIMTYGIIADNKFKIKVFKLPETSNATVTLIESDVIDEWVIQDQINETFTYQGATIVYNTLYLVGFVSATGNYIWAIDKNSHSMIGRVDLSKIITYVHECEDVALYDNKLVISTHTKRVYSMEF